MKTHSISFNGFQNILFRDRSHFNLLPGVVSPFSSLHSVLSKLRTWIHNSWMPGYLWIWRFSSYQTLSDSFSLIHSLQFKLFLPFYSVSGELIFADVRISEQMGKQYWLCSWEQDINSLLKVNNNSLVIKPSEANQMILPEIYPSF